MKKSYKDSRKKTVLVFVLIFIFALLFVLYRSQNSIQLLWCDNCDQIKAVTHACAGLKFTPKVVFKIFCWSFPI